MRNHDQHVLLVAGVVSGYLSGYLSSGQLDPETELFTLLGPDILNFFSVFGPGILFGLVIAGYYIYVKQLQSVTALSKAAVFIVASGVAYYSAFVITAYTENFFFGGVVGAAIFLAGVHFLLRRLHASQFYGMLILGGVLGLVGQLGETHWVFTDFSLLFMAWQGGMAFALGTLKRIPTA